MRDLHCARAARVRYRDHDVYVVIIAELPDDLVGQPLAHAQPGLVDGDVVDDRIGARQIDELEYAGRVSRRGDALTRMQSAIDVDEDGFAGAHVAEQLEIEDIQRYALRSEHVLRTVRPVPRWPSTSGRMPCGSRKPTTP